MPKISDCTHEYDMQVISLFIVIGYIYLGFNSGTASLVPDAITVMSGQAELGQMYWSVGCYLRLWLLLINEYGNAIRTYFPHILC